MRCPICSQPVTEPRHDSPSKLRVYCSKPCRYQGISRTIRVNGLFVDEVAVFRLLEGWPVASTRSERIEAVRVLTVQGRSAVWIADYLRITRRSVERYRHEIHPNRKAVA